MLQKGQTFSHITLTKYYEIVSIFNSKVHFIYYDSREGKEHYASRSITAFERLIDKGVLIRD